MAILFDDAASERLSVASAVATAAPITMACWFNTDNNSANQTLMDLHASGYGSARNNFMLRADGFTGGDPLTARTGGASSAALATTTSGYSVNTWHHACGVFAATNSRSVYIDGGSKGTDTGNLTPAGVDETIIAAQGGLADDLYVSGMMAEAAIWNIALSDAEVAILAMGFSPLFVRPESLVFYLPMIALGGGGTQQDWIGGRTMTETNTPATAAHPPNIIYPSWLTTGYGISTAASVLSGSLIFSGNMVAIPLSAEYRQFSVPVPRTTFGTNRE